MDECDFCSSPNVVHRYQCCDFDSASKDVGIMFVTPEGLTNAALASYDYWAACATCKRYVDAEDLDGLLVHVIDALGVAKWPDMGKRHFFIRHCEHTYKLFFAHRIRVSDPASGNPTTI
jgi:hypothetical protein